MKIAMVTNNYLPNVGGVTSSLISFTHAYRALGHRVLIVAPKTSHALPDSAIIPIPSIRLTHQWQFAMPLPVPGIIPAKLKQFSPDIIHTHHPFILGAAAATSAFQLNVPLVFTYHTMYEHYAHYIASDSPHMGRLARNIAAGYANICDAVFAPTPGVASLLQKRGVTAPIEVIPTGIDTSAFKHGSGAALRKRFAIPPKAFVVGHVGRLAPEKNPSLLMRALVDFLHMHPAAHALIVGDGSMRSSMEEDAKRASLSRRLHFAGTLRHGALIDSYHAIDLFAFTSTTETQGIVLLEALASGVPIVALDAIGTRDFITHGKNGWLVPQERTQEFAPVLSRAAHLVSTYRKHYRQCAYASAARYDQGLCADRALRVYHSLIGKQQPMPGSQWQRLMAGQWALWTNRVSSAYSAIQKP